jgi:Acyltransferase
MRCLQSLVLGVIGTGLSLSAASAFVPSQPLSRIRSQQPPALAVSIPPNDDVRTKDFRMTDEQVNPIIRLGKKDDDNEKVINLHGLWCVVVTLLTCPIWAATMSLLSMMHGINPEFDVNRELYDKTGKIWSRTWLTMTDSYPTFSGDLDQIKQERGPCLYVANHASWLDIPIICTVLDPVFKFIAKSELEKLPCIGQQLTGVSICCHRWNTFKRQRCCIGSHLHLSFIRATTF